jgi:hypothetical protein
MENWSLEYCWSVLAPWKRHLMLCGVCAMTLTFVMTRFLLTPWYRAQSILRPASQEPQSSTNLGAILGNITSGGSNSPLGSLFGTSASDANEFIAVVTSVEFTNKLVAKYNLESLLLKHAPLTALLLWWSYGAPHHLSSWMRYKMMDARFDYRYDDKEGNLTLWFQDPDRHEAKRILDGYVDLLRERLRARYVEAANIAIKALEQQVSRTSDMLLAGQLDQLLAQQIEQVGTAELQAGFAFVIIDPPIVPDYPYRPQPIIDSLLALILAPMAACGWLLLRNPRKPRSGRKDSVTEHGDGQFARRAVS